MSTPHEIALGRLAWLQRRYGADSPPGKDWEDLGPEFQEGFATAIRGIYDHFLSDSTS